MATGPAGSTPRRLALALLLSAALAAAEAAVVSGSHGGDEALAEVVYARITDVWGEPTASLTVAVQGGLVELTGEAPSSRARTVAEEVADATPGVVTVLNRLQVAER